MGSLLLIGSANMKVLTPEAIVDRGATDHTVTNKTNGARQLRLRRMVDDYIDLVGRVLRNAGTPVAEIEDAVQRTFIIADKRLDDVHPGAEKSFLLQIAIRVAAHARRSAARRREVPAAEPPEVTDSATPEQLTSQKRTRQLLDQVLDLLGPDLRTVFVLYEFEEMSMAEIAAALGIPQGTVASRLRRARVEFRERVAALELSGKKVQQ